MIDAKELVDKIKEWVEHEKEWSCEAFGYDYRDMVDADRLIEYLNSLTTTELNIEL